jgi:hypothetical protein
MPLILCSLRFILLRFRVWSSVAAEWDLLPILWSPMTDFWLAKSGYLYGYHGKGLSIDSITSIRGELVSTLRYFSIGHTRK